MPTDKNNIKKENLHKYKEVRGDKNKVYNQNVTDDMLKKDNKAKSLIMNSISNEDKLRLNFRTSTSYEIFKILVGSHSYSNNERKQLLLKELDKLLYYHIHKNNTNYNSNKKMFVKLLTFFCFFVRIRISKNKKVKK